MRMIRPAFRHESALRGRCRNALGQANQVRGRNHIGKKDPGAIEEPKFPNPHPHRRRMNLSQLRNYALTMLLVRIPQELQRDMPRFGRRPPQAAVRRFQLRRHLRKLIENLGGEWKTNE
jgi:hypothetical protein